MVKKILFLLLSGLLSLSMPILAIAQQPHDSAIQIAYVPGLADDPFYITLQSGILQGLADVDADAHLITRSPERINAASQITLVEALIEEGETDYLLISPTDMQALIPVFERAYQAGIEIITVDTFIGDGDYTSGSETFPLAYIGSDNFTSGFLACKALADGLSEGASVYIQHVESGISTVDQREAGCEAAAYAFGLEIVGVDYNADDALIALEQTAAILETYPNLAGIFGTNSFGAYGAGLAVRRAGLVGAVKIVAIDATTSVISMLEEGVITEIIAQKPLEMGYWAAVLTVAHALGYESIPKRVHIDHVLMHADNLADPAIARFRYAPTLQTPAPRLTDLTIAFVPGVQRYDPPDTFFTTLSKGIRSAQKTYGIQLIEQAPAHFSPAEQIPVIEGVIAENDIDYLIVTPTDRDALTPLLAQIHASGIPVITVDTFVGDGDYAAGRVLFPLSYIGSDNVMGGYIGCSQLAMADILGTGASIYIQNVRPGISTTDQRAEGCLVAARDFGLDVVQIDYSDNVVEVGQTQTIDVLAAHPNIVGIFGTNVFSAQGAGSAVQAVGLDGIVEVVAFDATEYAIDLLREGTVTQVIAQKPADMGYFAVLSAVAHARGFDSIPRRWSTGYEVINLNNVDDPEIARFIYRED